MNEEKFSPSPPLLRAVVDLAGRPSLSPSFYLYLPSSITSSLPEIGWQLALFSWLPGTLHFAASLKEKKSWWSRFRQNVLEKKVRRGGVARVESSAPPANS